MDRLVNVNVHELKRRGYATVSDGKGRFAFRRITKEGKVTHDSGFRYDDEDFAWLGAGKHAGMDCKGPKEQPKRKADLGIRGEGAIKVMRDPEVIERNEPQVLYLRQQEAARLAAVGLTVSYRR